MSQFTQGFVHLLSICNANCLNDDNNGIARNSGGDGSGSRRHSRRVLVAVIARIVTIIVTSVVIVIVIVMANVTFQRFDMSVLTFQLCLP